MKTRREIHLHIDRLVLDGLPAEPSQSSLVTAAFEAEVTRLFASFEIEPHQGRALASIVVRPTLSLDPASSEAIGGLMARAVHQAVTQSFSPAPVSRAGAAHHAEPSVSSELPTPKESRASHARGNK